MSLSWPLVALEGTGTVGGAGPRGWSTLAALENGKETPETRVVVDGVEGVSGERVRQLTAEQIGSAPQFREEKLPVEQFFRDA